MGKETSKKELVYVLPFRLPTWNRILAMHTFTRKTLRDFIHKFVISIVKKEKIDEEDLKKYYRIISPKAKKKKPKSVRQKKKKR